MVNEEDTLNFKILHTFEELFLPFHGRESASRKLRWREQLLIMMQLQFSSEDINTTPVLAAAHLFRSPRFHQACTTCLWEGWERPVSENGVIILPFPELSWHCMFWKAVESSLTPSWEETGPVAAPCVSPWTISAPLILPPSLRPPGYEAASPHRANHIHIPTWRVAVQIPRKQCHRFARYH